MLREKVAILIHKDCIRKVLLLVPPQDFGYGYINDFFWQQGILFLATHLNLMFGDSAEIEICDGNYRTLEYCQERITSSEWDVVGFHCVDHTKSTCLQLARSAVQAGARFVVFGGASAWLAPEQYVMPLRNVEESALLSCCIGTGEAALEAILRGEKMLAVPNLIFREGRGANASLVRSTITLSDDSRRGSASLRYELYSEIADYLRLQVSRGDFPYSATTYSALSHEGCIHRTDYGELHQHGCAFCGIPHPRFIQRNPFAFWQEVAAFDRHSRLVSGYPVRSIKDWGDSISPVLLKNLLAARPSSMYDIEYSCYLSLADVTPAILKQLLKMNCYSVYVGFDGASDCALARNGKGYTVSEALKRLELIASCGFRIELGMILGSAGDCLEDVENAVQLVSKIAMLFAEKVVVLQGNILIPMTGSAALMDLRERMRASNEGDPLFMDVEERTRSWLRHFTSLGLDTCLQGQSEIERISPRGHSYLREAS